MAWLDKEIHTALTYGTSVFSELTIHPSNQGTSKSYDMWRAFQAKMKAGLGEFVNDMKERIRTLRNSQLETYTTIFGDRDIVAEVEKLVAAKDHKGLLDMSENFSQDLDTFFSKMRKTFKIVAAACDIAEVCNNKHSKAVFCIYSNRQLPKRVFLRVLWRSHSNKFWAIANWQLTIVVSWSIRSTEYLQSVKVWIDRANQLINSTLLIIWSLIRRQSSTIINDYQVIE